MDRVVIVVVGRSVDALLFGTSLQKSNEKFESLNKEYLKIELLRAVLLTRNLFCKGQMEF